MLKSNGTNQTEKKRFPYRKINVGMEATDFTCLPLNIFVIRSLCSC